MNKSKDLTPNQDSVGQAKADHSDNAPERIFIDLDDIDMIYNFARIMAKRGCNNPTEYILKSSADKQLEKSIDRLTKEIVVLREIKQMLQKEVHEKADTADCLRQRIVELEGENDK